MPCLCSPSPSGADSTASDPDVSYRVDPVGEEQASFVSLPEMGSTSDNHSNDQGGVLPDTKTDCLSLAPTTKQSPTATTKSRAFSLDVGDPDVDMLADEAGMVVSMLLASSFQQDELLKRVERSLSQGGSSSSEFDSPNKTNRMPEKRETLVEADMEGRMGEQAELSTTSSGGVERHSVVVVEGVSEGVRRHAAAIVNDESDNPEDGDVVSSTPIDAHSFHAELERTMLGDDCSSMSEYILPSAGCDLDRPADIVSAGTGSHDDTFPTSHGQTTPIRTVNQDRYPNPIVSSTAVLRTTDGFGDCKAGINPDSIESTGDPSGQCPTAVSRTADSFCESKPGTTLVRTESEDCLSSQRESMCSVSHAMDSIGESKPLILSLTGTDEKVRYKLHYFLKCWIGKGRVG